MLWLVALLGCPSQADPTVDPTVDPHVDPRVDPPQETPVEEPVAKVVKVEIMPDKPIQIPTLGARVTLTHAKTSLHRDPETGRKYHTSSGTLLFQVGDQIDEIQFGPGKSVVWQGRRISVRGSRGWFELVIQPQSPADWEDPVDP
jgi:hypothetical protein